MKSSISELGIVMRPGLGIRRRTLGTKEANGSTDSKAIAPNNFSTASIKVSVTDLRIEANIGVYAHEKGLLRPLIVDIEVVLSPNVKIEDDKLSTTLDYDFLVGEAQTLAKTRHFNLIETFALCLCDNILQDEKTQQVRIKIQKPEAVKGVFSSGTEIIKTRA